eukprot:TRINITY_DN18865_c1_g1_i1.p1 TRINITY_DN18865_c1_g1~~TRINITY_DN18865_c1_g1_i1.p1  ORF type:complete len:524 (-),score=97.53 TRINITY_DN18865_c1_g1_i1:56-1627(-)
MAASSAGVTLGPGAPTSTETGRGIIGPVAHMVGRGLGTAVAAKENMVSKSQVVAGLAVAAASEAADKVEQRMTEDQKQRLSTAAVNAKDHGAALANRGAEVGLLIASAAKDGYDTTQNQVAAAKQAAFDALPEEDKRLLLEARRRYQEKKEALKEQVLDFTSPHAWKLVEMLKTMIVKEATSDPHMWKSAKRGVRWALDSVFDDIKVEAGKALKGVVLSVDSETSDAPDRCILHPGRLRAFVLHHLYPHDRSFFGKLRDPFFYILTLPSLVPLFCIREVYFMFILFLLVLSRPPDEFQLCAFILQFKSKQFITGGFLASMIALLRSFLCRWAKPWGVHVCVDPEGAIFGAAQFFLSIVLMWIAFMLLPVSKQYGETRFVAQSGEASGAAQLLRLEAPKKRTACCGCLALSEDRGGRLAGLLKWDLACFLVACLIFGALFAVGYTSLGDAGNVQSGQMMEVIAEALLYARCVYSFLSFPFFIFEIPGLSRLLMHTHATGFDRYGRCVPFRLAVVKSDGAVQPDC